MIKLRKPFSQKIQLHIRQDILQRLWDKYVPVSSPEYGRIELVYLKGGPAEMEKQPERIQLLLQLLLKNKMMQLNLIQYPAVVKFGQKQMESSLRRTERYYAVQLKSADPVMYRTVRQYFMLLEQIGEDNKRYQGWQKTNLAIEKQKEEYRLLSLFSEKLRERLTVHSINTLRMVQRDFVNSLTETEYHLLTEELIWQDKPALIGQLNEWDEAQCGYVVRELEKNTEIGQILSWIPAQSVKEKLITAAQKLGLREFCLFYHQVMKLDEVMPKVVLWKESRTEMLHHIDQMESGALQQVWERIEYAEHQFESDTLRVHDQSVQNQEKELLDSLLETEYQTMAERLIWQEKPELIAHFRECEKAQCKEVIRQLEKDSYLKRILSAIQKQSPKKKLIAAAYKLEQSEFCRFYWQVTEFLKDSLPIVIWKKSRTEMLFSIEELSEYGLQQVWNQMQAAEPAQGLKAVFVEKMLHLQEQYQQKKGGDFHEQIDALLKESDLAGIADLVNLAQLTQENDTVEYAELSVSADGERRQLVLREEADQVLRYLEHECAMRRDKIEQQQMQAARTYQEVYHQIIQTEESMERQQENAAQAVKQLFRQQYQEPLTEAEIQAIYEWSQVFQNVYLAQQGQTGIETDFPEESAFSSEQSELIPVFEKMNQYITDPHMKEQHAAVERLILRRQEALPKDERVQQLLTYIETLEEQQRDKFIHALADMVQLSVQLSFRQKAAAPFEVQEPAKKQLLETKDQEFARELLWVEDREFARKLLWLDDWELAKSLVQLEDTKLAKRLLALEDIELVRRFVQLEDTELAGRLLALEDQEFVRKLLQTGTRAFGEKLLQDSGGQLMDVSYRSLWEWGETLLFHPEQEDADILSYSQQDAFSSEADKAQQIDVQTQMIRRQIEMAKDRNRLQSLIRQINHQADLQLVYTDALLRVPQVQTLLQYAQQLDETQYGMLVKELAQITKLQKLSYEEPETNAGIDNDHGDSSELLMQGDAFESGREPLHKLRTEDKKLIGELLQIEDREYAERLLQEGDRELIEKFLRLENKEFAEKLLRINDREVVGKLLQDTDRASQTSYRDLWEWGEALLLHPEDQKVAASFSLDYNSSDFNASDISDAQQTQAVHQKNHLQSLIGQINRQADVKLVYTDEQLRMPQIQSLLQYVRQLDVKQYGAFAKELAQIMMVQKLSQIEMKTEFSSDQIIEPACLSSEAISLEKENVSYDTLVRFAENYESSRRLAHYKNLRTIEQKLFPQTYTNRQQAEGISSVENAAQRTAVYSLILDSTEPYEQGFNETGISESTFLPYEDTASEYVQIHPYEGNYQESSYQPHELEYSVQKASVSEEEQQRSQLRMQQETAHLRSVQDELDKKLKEVEHQLKKVEGSTKAKEDVKTFAEQVKRQLYEELHVEKLRRGLI